MVRIERARMSGFGSSVSCGGKEVAVSSARYGSVALQSKCERGTHLDKGVDGEDDEVGLLLRGGAGSTRRSSDMGGVGRDVPSWQSS